MDIRDIWEAKWTEFGDRLVGAHLLAEQRRLNLQDRQGAAGKNKGEKTNRDKS